MNCSCGIVAKWKFATSVPKPSSFWVSSTICRTVSADPTATKPFSISVSMVIPPATSPDLEAMIRAIPCGVR